MNAYILLFHSRGFYPRLSTKTMTTSIKTETRYLDSW